MTLPMKRTSTHDLTHSTGPDNESMQKRIRVPEDAMLSATQSSRTMSVAQANMTRPLRSISPDCLTNSTGPANALVQTSIAALEDVAAGGRSVSTDEYLLTFKRCAFRSSVSSLAWAPDGKKLAIGGFKGELVVIDGTARKSMNESDHVDNMLQIPVKIRTGQMIHSIAWSPNGDRLAFVVHRVCKCVVIEVSTGAVVFEVPCPGEPCAVAWSLDGQSLAVGNQGVTIAQTDTGRVLSQLGAAETVHCVDWAPDGRHLAVGYGGFGSAIGKAQVVDTVSGEVKFTAQEGMSNGVHSVKWAPKVENLAITCHCNSGADYVSCTTMGGTCIGIFHVPPGQDALGTWLAEKVREATKHIGGRLQLVTPEGEIFWSAPGPKASGMLLAFGGWGHEDSSECNFSVKIQVIDFPSTKIHSSFDGWGDCHLAWSPNGAKLVIGPFAPGKHERRSVDKDITVVDVGSGEVTHQLACRSQLRAMSLSPDAKHLAVAVRGEQLGPGFCRPDMEIFDADEWMSPK